MPALLTSTSSPCSAAITRGTTLSICARSARSQVSVMTCGCETRSDASSDASMSMTPTFAPAAEKACAISRPIPEAPAVISTFCMARILPEHAPADSTVGTR
jgi:hypothetical protein